MRVYKFILSIVADNELLYQYKLLAGCVAIPFNLSLKKPGLLFTYLVILNKDYYQFFLYKNNPILIPFGSFHYQFNLFC